MDETPQRRVSARKRNRPARFKDSPTKTPKKGKHDLSADATPIKGHTGRNRGRTSNLDTNIYHMTSPVHNAPKHGWIQNSFMSGQADLSVERILPDRSRDILESGASGDGHDSHTHNSHMKSGMLRLDHGNYAAQDQSFNDSDLMLAEIDLDNLEKQQTLDDFPPSSQLDHMSYVFHPSAKEGNRSAQKNKPKVRASPVIEDDDIIGIDSSQNVVRTVLQGPDVGTTYTITSAEELPDVDKYTPARTLSIREKIKRALAKNARTSTTPSRIGQLKMESVAKAMKDAEDIHQQGTDCDIGPFYGLPSRVRELLYKHRKIKTLYDWQHECLSLPAVKESKNLIYSLPTSGGKTLVAEVLILRELLCKKRDVLFILPFVAIVQEKVKGLSAFGLELDFMVEEYAAAKGAIPPRTRQSKKSVYICTIEKANSLYNSLIELKRTEEIGLVVVDELHMLGEGGSRGACLEMTLAKIRHIADSTQIIGMSATLSNISDLSTFLNAHVYSNDFRPVKLEEYVKMSDTLYKINPNALCPDDRFVHNRVVTFKYGVKQNSIDPDHIGGMVGEVVPKHSCLVFCATKKNCENVAGLLCKMLPQDLREWKAEEKKALLKALYVDGNGEICPVLRKTVQYGIAYHHSGLTGDERKLIEEAYSEGTLCVLCCTSTLAAGVNLPAKRVILRSPYVGMAFMSRSQYKQMIGRAGRAGLDSSGESILIVQKRDQQQLANLVTGPMDHCSSSLLYEDSKGMRGLLLTTIGLQVTPNFESAHEFLQHTLCHVQSKSKAVDLCKTIKEALQHLVDKGLVQQVAAPDSTDTNLIEVTKVGRATFKGAIDVNRGSQLYKDLADAQQSLVLANYLHLLYLVTPYDLAENISPNWMIYFEEVNLLKDSEMKVLEVVGVSASYVCKRATGQRSKPIEETVIKRFYLTLMLYHLWKRKSIWEVASRFLQPRGFIQSLLNGASSFASCVSHYCKELEEFWAYQDLFANFVKKLAYCFILELMPLMEVPGVKIGRARQLHQAGYKTLQQISYADPEVLVKTVDHMPHKTAIQIVAAAKMMMKEKAEALLEEAEDIITVPSDMPVAVEVEISTSP